MQFYQNSRQFRPPLHKHEILRTVVLEEDQAKCVEKRKSTRELLQNRMKKLKRALMGRSSLRASSQSLESQGAVGQEGKHMTSFKCRKTLLFLFPWNRGPSSSGSSNTGQRTGTRRSASKDPHDIFAVPV